MNKNSAPIITPQLVTNDLGNFFMIFALYAGNYARNGSHVYWWPTIKSNICNFRSTTVTCNASRKMAKTNESYIMINAGNCWEIIVRWRWTTDDQCHVFIHSQQRKSKKADIRSTYFIEAILWFLFYRIIISQINQIYLSFRFSHEEEIHASLIYFQRCSSVKKIMWKHTLFSYKKPVYKKPRARNGFHFVINIGA